MNKANREANGDETEVAFSSSVFHGRLGIAAEARRQLEAQLSEAEVLWRTDPTALIGPLWDLESELILAVQLHLRREWHRRNGQSSIWEEIEQQFDKHKGVLLKPTGPPTEREIAFEQRVATAVRTIEATFKSHFHNGDCRSFAG